MAYSFLALRAEIIQAVRSFFIGRGYLEVDTPLRLPSLIPEANIEPVEAGGWFLQTSPELCMKRLLARGHEKVFQICKCFRKHERGTRHLSEFTMLEWYCTDIYYMDLMAECEEMLRFLVAEVDLPGPAAGIIQAESGWQYLSVSRAFEMYGQLPVQQALRENVFDDILVRDIEPRLGLERPVFLYDYPAETASLACLKTDDTSLAERFELYIKGVELANGFTELTDSEEQRFRFVKERELCRQSGRDFGPMPEKFLDDLEQIDKAAGIALGIDRLVMLLCGAERIDDVVPFTPESL